MSIKVIITGATGMVGEGVMLECLENTDVSEILLVSRRPYGLQHPKLKECIVADFMKLEGCEEQMTGYDACFFCAGISSIGLKEEEYKRITYDITLHFAHKLISINPDMTFIYISGASTDSTEKGRMMWARVKGRTENELLKLPFKAVYCFRPGFMKAVPGQKHVNKYYKYVAWLFPFMRSVFPNTVSTLSDVAKAMINSVIKGYPKRVLEIKDINALAKM
jgi:hypothetical protein